MRMCTNSSRLLATSDVEKSMSETDQRRQSDYKLVRREGSANLAPVFTGFLWWQNLPKTVCLLQQARSWTWPATAAYITHQTKSSSPDESIYHTAFLPSIFSDAEIICKTHTSLVTSSKTQKTSNSRVLWAVSRKKLTITNKDISTDTQVHACHLRRQKLRARERGFTKWKSTCGSRAD